MKKYLASSFMLLLAVCTNSQTQFSNTTWYAHTNIPVSADIQLVDSIDFYPKAKFKNRKLADNVIRDECSRTTLDPQLPAYYSNYGKQTVDLFAPGYDSYGPFVNNNYGYAGGTSNAAPFVVGVAAFLKSYFPELTMFQIKNIILESVHRPDIKVILPLHGDPALSPARRQELINAGPIVPFSSLSKTGGILDAEAAVRKSAEMTKQNSLKSL